MKNSHLKAGIDEILFAFKSLPTISTNTLQ